MIDRNEIIARAREYLGTPFAHQGRLKGVGIDCAGLIICVAKDMGLSDFDVTNYPRIPDGITLKRTLNEQMQNISVADILPGDVLLFAFINYPQHLAFVSNIGIIHAYQAIGKCVEHRLDSKWKARIRGAYRFKWLA